MSKLQFSTDNLLEKLRKRFEKILSLDKIGKIVLTPCGVEHLVVLNMLNLL